MKQINVDTKNIISQLPSLVQQGVTELSLHDKSISADKKFLIELMKAVSKKAPDLFITIPVQAQCIDGQFIQAAQEINCSLEIPLTCTQKGEALLFDKKLYSSKANLLNKAELVFGFNMEWGIQSGDTYKLFRDRLDFALSLYPNHIDFEQLSGDASKELQTGKATGIFSSRDLEYSRDIAFACYTFYSCGRAVPWFNSILKPLKITPSAFLADFAEWQRCSSCSINSGFLPDEASHKEIEKMQLVFLQQKFEEKHKEHLFTAVQDSVRINGAFSRLVSEGEEEILETSYNPDDLLSPQIYDIVKFCDNVCLEDSSVKLFLNEGYPDYKIL